MRNSTKVVLLTAAGFLSQASTVLLGMLFVRYYTQEAYGTFRQAHLVVSSAAYILLLNIPSSILYFFPNLNEDQKKGFLLQTIGLMAVIGMAGTLSVYGASAFITDKFNNPALARVLPFFSLYVLLQILSSYAPAMFMGLDRYKKASLFQVCLMLFQFGVVSLGIVSNAKIEGVMKIMIACMAVEVFVYAGAAWRQFSWRNIVWDKRLIRAQLRYSIPFGIGGIVWFIGKEIDKYYLSVFFDPAVYSIYVVGALEIPFFRQISVSIRSVQVPLISQLNYEAKLAEIHDQWRETIRKSILVFFPSFGLFFVVSKSLIVFLYTDSYSGSVVIFQIYLLMILLRIFNPEIILLGLGKTRMILINAIIFFTVNLGLNFVFVKVIGLGIKGPAVSTILAYVLMSLIATVAACRYAKARFKDVFPFVDFLKVSVATCGAGGLVHFFAPAMSGPFLEGAVRGLGFSIFFFGGAFCLKAVTKDDMTILLPWLKG